jgi:hypothetical protein
MDDAFVNLLKEILILCKCAPPEATENAFERALIRFQNWIKGLPAQVSVLSQRLYLLSLLEEELDAPAIRKDTGIVDTILTGSGIREVGEQFERVGPNGIKVTWTVIWRKIGPMWGVEMGLRNDEGKITAGEFFD